MTAVKFCSNETKSKATCNICIRMLFAAAIRKAVTLNDGTSHEGEVYKCTPLKLTIINAEKKRTTIDLDDLSDKDKAYLKKAYPEFFAAAKNAPIAEGDNSVESSPKYLKWPDIKIKKDDLMVVFFILYFINNI